MPDIIFEHPRLVALYDELDGPRHDLDHYLTIARRLNARSLLDVGSGTGCFALMAAQQGFEVTAVEPALASLEFARRKPGADQVHWIHGEATALHKMRVDLAVMTGNVAQVFLLDTQWEETLTRIRETLHSKGHLVFEVRDPKQKAWLGWTREKTHQRRDLPNLGTVETWCEVTDVTGELVSFQWTYVFESDGQVIKSDSTLRFRKPEAIKALLERTGFFVREVLDAPDRPQKEFVFVARRIQS